MERRRRYSFAHVNYSKLCTKVKAKVQIKQLFGQVCATLDHFSAALQGLVDTRQLGWRAGAATLLYEERHRELLCEIQVHTRKFPCLPA